MAAPGVRSQDGRKKGKKSLLFYSAGPGVRGQDERDNERDKWKETSFFLGIQRRRLAAKGQPGEARFGPELDWEKAWRGQVFGDPEARERKGDREVGWDESQMGKSCGGARAFGTESATRRSCCGPELDGEKLWRRQVFGARMGARKERKVFCFIQRGQVFGARMSETMSETNGKKLLFF